MTRSLSFTDSLEEDAGKERGKWRSKRRRRRCSETEQREE